MSRSLIRYVHTTLLSYTIAVLINGSSPTTKNSAELNADHTARTLLLQLARKKDFLPCHLRRALTLKELLNQKKKTDENGKKIYSLEVRKMFSLHVRRTVPHRIEFRTETGVITDELAILNQAMTGPEATFSVDGDSGSLIWDVNGYVAAMLWSGPNTNITYATPIEDVLDDIRETCGHKEVKLIVRTEDETDVVFGSPRVTHEGLCRR